MADADQLGRVFANLFRNTTKPVGAGLGLALAREIIEAHGGSLMCRSQDGGCFVVTLPLRTATETLASEEVAR